MAALGDTLAVAMVAAVCLLLLIGYPVALTLGGVSLGFAALGASAGVMNFGLLGALLERSRIAEELLETMARLFGALPGGLGLSVVFVGMLLAAAKGVVGATT